MNSEKKQDWETGDRGLSVPERGSGHPAALAFVSSIEKVVV